MSEQQVFQVEIEDLGPDYHSNYRYLVYLQDGPSKLIRIGTACVDTHWGGRIAAKRIIKKYKMGRRANAPLNTYKVLA